MSRVTFRRMARQADEPLELGDRTTALELAEQLITACEQETRPNKARLLDWRAFRAKVLTEARRYLDAEAELGEVDDARFEQVIALNAGQVVDTFSGRGIEHASTLGFDLEVEPTWAPVGSTVHAWERDGYPRACTPPKSTYAR